MGSYLGNFAVYTLAMAGLIFFALMVYKKAISIGGIKSSKNKILSVEETISIAPRKTLYVVKAGNEKFLIAGDVDKTTLISKLNSVNKTDFDVQTVDNIDESSDNISRTKTNKTVLKKSKSVDDISSVVEFSRNSGKQNVIKNMLKKINE